MANFADAIEPVKDLGGAISFPVGFSLEEASQTFVEGTPVQINGTDGGVQAWDGTTVARGIAGFAWQNANNLGTHRQRCASAVLSGPRGRFGHR